MQTHLDDLREQLEGAIAARDFDTASKLREQIDDARRDNLVRGVESQPQAAYFQRPRS